MKDKKTQCNDCSTIFTGDGVDDMCPSCEGKLHEIINNSKCECEHPVIESNMTVEYCRKCYRLMSKPSPSTVGSELKENNLPIGEQINVLADKIRRAKKKCYTLPSTNKVTTPAPLKSEGWEEEFALKFVPLKPEFSELAYWTKVLEGTTANYMTLLEYIRGLLYKAREEQRQSIIKKIREINVHYSDRSENRDDSYDDAFEDGAEVAQKKMLELLALEEVK